MQICVDWNFLAKQSNLTNYPISAIKALCEDIVQEAFEGVKDPGEESVVQSERSQSANENRKRGRVRQYSQA